jgi:TRAP-type mannitol/chloroaromatic compound transport system substrate-binding protein
MKRHRAVLVIVIVVAVFGLFVWPGLVPDRAGAQRPTTLRIQASFPAASLIFTSVLPVFAERVEKASGGRLRIQALPAGAIVPAFEVVDATHRGVIDGAYTCTYYFIGKHRAAALFTDVPGGPFGMDYIDWMAWHYQGGGLQLLNEFYQDVLKMDIVAWPIFPTTPQGLGWFKKELKSVEDMKGLKYRIPGIAAEVYRAMGVAVVTLPGGEILPAGERGVLDAAEWYTPGEDIRLGFHQIWKYYHYPGPHEMAGACDLLVKKSVFDKLPADLQELVRSLTLETAMHTLMEFNRKDAEGLRDLRDKHNVNLIRTPADIMTEHWKAWDKIAKDESAKDPFFKKVLDSQRAYAALVVPAKRFMSSYEMTADYYYGKPDW